MTDLSSSALGRALPGLLGGTVFLVLFVVGARALRSRELGDLGATLSRRLGR